MSIEPASHRRKIPAPIRRANLLARGSAVAGHAIGTQRRYYVSYAWGDQTPAGKDRDAAVERLCAAAEAQGTVVIRDKNVLRPGDRLSEFMKQLGNGDRIFALISDKYVRSTYCMTELLEVWKNSRQDEAEFCKRVCAYALPCARIRSLSDRVSYGAYWKNEHDAVEALVQQHGSGMLGKNGGAQHQLIARIASETTELLTILSDVVMPADFDEFLRYGFADLDEGN